MKDFCGCAMNYHRKSVSFEQKYPRKNVMNAGSYHRKREENGRNKIVKF